MLDHEIFIVPVVSLVDRVARDEHDHQGFRLAAEDQGGPGRMSGREA